MWFIITTTFDKPVFNQGWILLCVSQLSINGSKVKSGINMETSNPYVTLCGHLYSMNMVTTIMNGAGLLSSLQLDVHSSNPLHLLQILPLATFSSLYSNTTYDLSQTDLRCRAVTATVCAESHLGMRWWRQAYFGKKTTPPTNKKAMCWNGWFLWV